MQVQVEVNSDTRAVSPATGAPVSGESGPVGLVTKTEFARLYGCSQPYVSKLLSSRLISETPDGLIDFEAAIDAIRRVYDFNRGGKRNGGTTLMRESTEGELYDIRLQRERLQLQLEELELFNQCGLLVDRAGVERQAYAAACAARDELMAVPDRLAAIVAAQSDVHKVHQILEDEVRRIAQNLAEIKITEE